MMILGDAQLSAVCLERKLEGAEENLRLGMSENDKELHSAVQALLTANENSPCLVIAFFSREERH